MDWTLRELRYFVAAADAGSFTDAASDLGVSQAAVSRTIAGLENAMGVRLLRRVPRGCELTNAGLQLLPRARRVLGEADRLEQFVRSQHGTLRLGYAWAALGRYTARLQREWAASHDFLDLQLVRHYSPTSGLAEGLCDVAIVRRDLEDRRFESQVVGIERRVVAFASDDPQWARRRQLSMAEIADRVVLKDPRAGTTNEHLWAGTGRVPRFMETTDIDTWLDLITVGRAVGTTSEATAHHHPRPGVVYRPIKDGPQIVVRLVWWRDDHPAGFDDLIDAVSDLYAGD